MEPEIVNEHQCDCLTQLIKSVKLPFDREEPTPLQLDCSIIKDFYFVLVSISHQTSSLSGPNLVGTIQGKSLRGWDYLRAKLCVAIHTNPSIISPVNLASISSNNLKIALEDDNGRLSVSDLKGRVLLLNDLGERMLNLGYDSVQRLYDQSEGWLVREDKLGLLQQLTSFKAYSDPMRKKSLFLTTLMKNHGFWNYQDEDKLGPPVDYHEIRGHLRFGTIEAKEPKLFKKLQKNCKITEKEDIGIRHAVYKAIMRISRDSNTSPSVLHYFFWNLFRNCCDRKHPHCVSCPLNCALPERYVQLKKHKHIAGCLLSPYCASADSEEKLLEPKVVTEYY